ncbi:hypothetical protein EVAR_16363_1 [Eumeta japonica]|uniref:Uncharacterized protein n=1 Tax=Eumeta variegata TaxID=151549 RepID=A0A4C1VWQ4_EUMVA|nr:hypothetical protein EVAR_16363_1 [Eumeta japonica]
MGKEGYRALALAFPFRERQTRTDLGPPALRVLLADTRCRPPTLHNPHSILRTPLARSIADLARIAVRPLAYHGPSSPAPLGREGLAQNSHHVRIQLPTKALSGKGYEAPQDVVKTNRESDPVSSRASSRATSPMKTNKNKINARRAHRPTKERRPWTVVGSDSESENSGSRPAGDGHRPIIGAHIPCKRCKALPAAVQQTQTTSTASVESTRNPVSASTQAVTAKTAPRTGAKPTAPPRPKLPPPIFAQRR